MHQLVNMIQEECYKYNNFQNIFYNSWVNKYLLILIYIFLKNFFGASRLIVPKMCNPLNMVSRFSKKKKIIIKIKIFKNIF